MIRVLVALLLGWLALAVVGAAVDGLFWLSIVAAALFLGTAAYGAIKRRTGRRVS